jgi:hypothetical protein
VVIVHLCVRHLFISLIIEYKAEACPESTFSKLVCSSMKTTSNLVLKLQQG